MSSISTLELRGRIIVVAERELVGRNIFLLEVAETNKLELLKWAREEKKCEWDEGRLMWPHQGNLEMVKYCVANECPIDELACACAASQGHLECLKYLREEVKAPWDSWTASFAAANGHLHILEYLVERKYDQYSEVACANAAEVRPLRLFEVLARNRQSALERDRRTLKRTRTTNPECLQYLLDNNCPLPEGWRYEDGTLHTS